MQIYRVKDTRCTWFDTTSQKTEGVYFRKLKSAMEFRDKILKQSGTTFPHLVVIEHVTVVED